MRKKRKPLDKELVKKISNHLKYDPETGHFFWFNPTSLKSKRGWFAGSLYGKKGYLGFRVFWEKYYAHRLAWALSYGECPAELEIDHVNGNKADNRLSNLRLATASQNQHNKTAYKNNSSGVKGVNRDGKSGRWRAKFNLQGKRHELGLFDSLDAARDAVVRARSEAHGQFANHGEVRA